MPCLGNAGAALSRWNHCCGIMLLQIGPCDKLYIYIYICGGKRSGWRFWRIPYVENVIWDPTQLLGVGFPINFYVELILSGFCGFWTVWQRHISVGARNISSEREISLSERDISVWERHISVWERRLYLRDTDLCLREPYLSSLFSLFSLPNCMQAGRTGSPQ